MNWLNPKPRSGERVQPTAQAVGLPIKTQRAPKGAKETGEEGELSLIEPSRSSTDVILSAGEAGARDPTTACCAFAVDEIHPNCIHQDYRADSRYGNATVSPD
jgi:hypothetical protein